MFFRVFPNFVIWICVQSPLFHVLKFLLDHGANANWIGEGNQSTLCKAVASQNLDLVEIFVANGADVNQRFEQLNGDTVLVIACSVRNTLILVFDSNFCSESYFESHKLWLHTARYF